MRAPERYHKLYLVTVSRSKSGSWWAARRGASWRVVDEREDEAEHLRDLVKPNEEGEDDLALSDIRVEVGLNNGDFRNTTTVDAVAWHVNFERRTGSLRTIGKSWNR